MRSCTVYFGKNKFYILSDAVTKLGVGYSLKLVCKIDSESIELGEEIIKALDKYKTGIPEITSEEYKNDMQEFLDFMEVRSWSEVERKMKDFSVLDRDGSVTITPSKVAEDGGFNPVKESAIQCNLDATEIRQSMLSLVSNIN